MKDKKLYTVSFGDSDSYGVPFDGSIEEFKNSKEFNHIKDSVLGYVKEKFPAADTLTLITPEIKEGVAEDRYAELNNENLEKLKQDVVRQVEVMLQGKELNADALFSDIK